MLHLRIATRRSALAQWQASWVAQWLQARGVSTELVLLTSEGDIDQRPITDGSGRGLFTRRIQDAVLDGEADVAVHSLKDLPTRPTAGLVMAAIPPRERANDCLITRQQETLETLPPGAIVGTGSRRRAAQLLHLRPDLKIEPIRGNVDTRLRKLHDRLYDAIVLAEAGLRRLELEVASRQTLSLEQMLPAPGQGALGIEVRADDARALSALRTLDDPPTAAAVTAERMLLHVLEGGCLAPIAAHAVVDAGQLTLRAVVLSPDGNKRLLRMSTAPLEEASALGERLAQELIEEGALDLVTAARGA